MNDEVKKLERNSSDTTEATRDTYRAKFFFKVPQSVWDQVEEHRRSREEGREQLIQQLEDYDKVTRSYENDILQIWEMSLQSRSRPISLRNKDNERER